jgi:Bacteriophage protein of unknown function (DUF646).|nr:MAG TPA: tail component protein [Caudoviricetes sp.]
MAHSRFDGYKLKADLSVGGIKKLAEEVGNIQRSLPEMCDEFCRALAERGVAIAKEEISSMGAVETGSLLSSITMKRGDAVNIGSKWIIYTDCYYAEYVEFGTGSVGARNPHPSGEGMYLQDLSNKVMTKNGDYGWYFSGGFTTGMPSRPFMWNTRETLRQDSIIKEVAKEVFG